MSPILTAKTAICLDYESMRPAGRYRHVTANGGGCRVGLMELAREATSRYRGSFLCMLSLTPMEISSLSCHARSCSPPRGQISQCPLFSELMRRADVAWSGVGSGGAWRQDLLYKKESGMVGNCASNQ